MVSPLAFHAIVIFAQVARKRPTIPDVTFWDWLSQPSGSVFLVLLLALAIGGGAKWRQSIRARRALDRIAMDDPEVGAIVAMADHGRAGLSDLFRLLGHPSRPEVREAAGRALSRLWKADQLIPEEEHAVVSRGHVVAWKARRRYPRALTRPISMTVEFGLPFLDTEGAGVHADHLLWSYRVEGTDRVALETFSPWLSTPTRALFAIDPRDYPTNGPHRLVLHLRVRTYELTSTWERELPKVPFTFEFDPNLALDALLTTPDEPRRAALSRAIGLAPPTSNAVGTTFAPLNANIALRDPPVLQVQMPLPSDLAHGIRLEIEGIAGGIDSGEVVINGQATAPVEIPLQIPLMLADGTLDQPGDARVRVVLTVDSQLAWSNPDLRSVWPENLVTEWFPARLVRL